MYRTIMLSWLLVLGVPALADTSVALRAGLNLVAFTVAPPASASSHQMASLFGAGLRSFGRLARPGRRPAPAPP